MRRGWSRSEALVRAALVSAAVLLTGYRPIAAQALSERVRQQLITEPRDDLGALLARFYEQRAYRPGWVSDSGPTATAAAFAAILEAADADGLDPNDYPHTRIRALLGRARVPDTIAQLDVLLSRALLEYGSDLAQGRIDPVVVDSPWTAAPRPVDLVAALTAAVDSGRLVEALERLAPPQAGYAMLRRALRGYRDRAARGGWRAVPTGPALTPGMRDPRMGILRARLAGEGDLAAGKDSDDVYDSTAQQAVRRFQSRHGLDPDGVVGAATVAALNVPVEARVGQIELNLERWRWMPRSLGQRYIMVNSAAFTLEVVDTARQVMTMRAIVGRPDWPTPIVSSVVTGLVFSPVWNVPRRIALEEVLPLIQRHPRYLERHRFTVFDISSGAARRVDPASIDWAAMTEQTFTLQLRQAPGPDNPLGGVKVVFGTRFNVCIHDTPARSLFHERVRAFSHGCTRVERAAELATYLLADPVRWTADSVHARMTDSTERVVTLSPPIPVHLNYWTAWVSDDGRVEFRDDIYGWDAKLADALSNPPRTPNRRGS